MPDRPIFPSFVSSSAPEGAASKASLAELIQRAIAETDEGFLRFHQLRAVPLGRQPVSRAIGLAQRAGNPKMRLTAALLQALQLAAAQEAREG